MLESTESLLPKTEAGSRRTLKVVSVGFAADSLDELERLLQTLGVAPVSRLLVHSKKITPSTYIGAGKTEELREELQRAGADAAIFDVELSPNQLRNLEKAIEKPVLDRPGVIIEIFSRHAHTREAKTQVELARLQYLLPRLAHFWTHFERQRGGIGLKGMGEKQIEVDRRLVKKRMQILRERLKGIENERKIQRAGRKSVLKVAIVGYTNAGKSTILNALTRSSVRSEDKLFATLDASVRLLDPQSNPPIVAIDTVGFISQLPPSLVASFRSTLEELHEADLLLHVVDASSPQSREQVATTEQVLEEIGVSDKPRITVLNKIDALQGLGARNVARLASPGSMAVSALAASDMERLRDAVIEQFRKGLELWEIVVPYHESRLEARIRAHGSIEVMRHLEKGTFYRVRMDQGWARKLELERFRT